jgi:hydroxyacylglutathione hydrolase
MLEKEVLPMSTLEIHQIPTRTDNYVYLIKDNATGLVGVVDPSDAEPVLEVLDRLGWKLTHVLTTHHHNDHVGGVPELMEKTGCTVVGARVDRDRIPGIAVEVGDGDTYKFGEAEAQVYEVPGHTLGHIAYWFAESKALFCGDTLFALGCGRVFEGTHEQMWTSLSKFDDIPDDTFIFCAHEYTQANAQFAVSVDPDNADLQAYVQGVDEKRAADQPTVPSLMGDERKSNPFLRAKSPDLMQAIGMAGAGPVEIFAEVRTRKDNF